MDIANKFMVSANAGSFLIANPPRGPMTADDALLLAAWLVAMAEHESSQEFSYLLERVQGS